MQSGPRITFATLAASVGVGVCCWLSIVYTRQPGGFSTLWAGSGLLCGFLLTTPRREWPAYVAGGFAANFLAHVIAHDAPAMSMALALAGTLEATLVAWLVLRFVDDVTAPTQIRATAEVATLCTVVACGVGAFLAAGMRWLLNGGAFLQPLGSWFLSHGLGMVIFATLTVVARAEGRRLFGYPGRRIELALTLSLIALTSFAVFAQSRYPLLFLVHPILLLAVFRQRFSGLVLGTTTIALISTVATLAGYGPFMLIPDASVAERVVLLQLYIASVCLLALPVAVVLVERSALISRLAEREHQYRMLADYSRDLVIRFDATGARRYISPSVSEMLGWTREDLAQPRWDIVHPDDVGALRKALADLTEHGGDTTIQYRVRHKDGRYIIIEAHARRVPGPGPDDPPDIIYAGRDVTRRVEAERALDENQRRLRAITDNLPAFVIHVDLEEKYTFANAYTGQVLGIDPQTMIGCHVREVMGETVYTELKPHMDAAFAGATATFGIERDFQGRHCHYQSTYVPDVGVDGTVQGFYAVTFDISPLKQAERELTRLARYDTLTGLANRLHFRERIELAILRHQRSGRPIALLYLDIDHFKHINDTFGHASGDAVLVEFAQRLNESVRATDFAARLGGDEFVVLVEDADEVDAAETVAHKLIARMREGIGTGGQQLAVTTSIGIAFCRQRVANPDALMQLADSALYAAKAAGRNTYRVAQ